MSDPSNTKPEPQSFADLAMQPTGSGVADEETAFLEAALEDAAGATGTGDTAVVPTDGGPAEEESRSHPS